MSRCPTCGHDPEPLRRAQATYERRHYARRAEAKRKKREHIRLLREMGIVVTPKPKKGVEPKPDAG